MTKREYIEELRRLLGDIPKTELDEALLYYENYFEDAGEENEQHVIQSLGSPSHVADMIRSNVFGTADESKEEYTDSGYHNREFQEYYEVSRNDGEESNQEQERKDYQRKYGPYGSENKNPVKWILIGLICIICFPVIGGVAAGIFGAIFGIIAGVIGIGIGGLAGGVGMVIGGIALLIVGFANVALVPFSALFTIGVGCLLLGGGLLIFALGLLIFRKLVPAAYHWIINIFSRLYHSIRGRVSA
ncbi:hypothetical protein lbkm_0563 [Lachnospiraceae bacterium KM106-2]|nr:hypothetical protein lbkm_0563 [Lachnospiraceae bacterium KM106-2]